MTTKRAPELPTEVRFVCSKCGERYIDLCTTRQVAIDRVQALGWTVFPGESHCGACSTAEMVGALATSLPIAKPRRQTPRAWRPNPELWNHADGSTHASDGPAKCPVCSDLRRVRRMQ